MLKSLVTCGPLLLSPTIIARYWHPPEHHSLKTNWDVKFLSNTNIGSLRGVTRDSKGDILVSFSCRAENTLNQVVETLALRKAIIICAEMGFYNMTFEGDCLPVVIMVNSTSTPSSFARSIIFYIQQLLLGHSH